MPRTLWGGGGVLFTYKSTSLWRPPAPWPRGLQPQMGTLTHPCLSLTEGTQFSLWLRSHVYRPRRCRSEEPSQGSVVLTDLCPLQLAQSKTLRATFFFFLSNVVFSNIASKQALVQIFGSSGRNVEEEKN